MSFKLLSSARCSPQDRSRVLRSIPIQMEIKIESFFLSPSLETMMQRQGSCWQCTQSASALQGPRVCVCVCVCVFMFIRHQPTAALGPSNVAWVRPPTGDQRPAAEQRERPRLLTLVFYPIHSLFLVYTSKQFSKMVRRLNIFFPAYGETTPCEERVNE